VSDRPTLTGDVTILNNVQIAATWDSTNACIWLHNGVTLCKFDPATLVVTTQATTGSSPPEPVYGPYDRLLYVPALKGLIYQPTWASSTYFLRTAL
jgi:hypothetical protein